MSKGERSSSRRLARSSDFFRRLCDDAGVGIIAVDRRLEVCVWNRAAGQLLAADAEQRLGQPAELAVPESDRQQFVELLSRAIEEEAVGEMEMRHPRQPAEAELNLIVTISPIRDKAGHSIGASAWVRDISKRVRLERWMARSERMVALGVMASGVAHHFNNILAGVVTAVEHALASGDRESLRRGLQRAADAVTRATSITDHLLAFAEGDHRTDSEADLTELMLTFVDRAERELAQRGIKLEFEHQPIPVRAVPANRWSAVLNHLYHNALEALVGRGRLVVRLEPAGSEVLVSIADTGPGIPREHLDRIFEPFFTTKAGEDSFKSSGHTGLGLAVVHGLVKDMGGRVEVNSVIGQGTEFQIYLPLADRPRSPHTMPTASTKA